MPDPYTGERARAKELPMPEFRLRALDESERTEVAELVSVSFPTFMPETG